MYIILQVFYININAEEKQNLETEVLVVIDSSGSMKQLDIAIREVLQMILSFETLEHYKLMAEYFLFNETGIEWITMDRKSATPIEEIQYGGETSIYVGLEGINDWVNKELEDNTSINLLMLSDLFSSRDKNGKIFDWETARREQRRIDIWITEWKKLIRKNKFNPFFMRWESMTPKENIYKTLEYLEKNGNISNGYQIVLQGMQNNEFLMQEVKTENDINAEQEIVGESACYILEIITEKNNLFWKKKGLIKQPDMSVKINVPRGKRLLIRIDKENGESGAEISY